MTPEEFVDMYRRWVNHFPLNPISQVHVNRTGMEFFKTYFSEKYKRNDIMQAEKLQIYGFEVIHNKDLDFTDFPTYVLVNEKEEFTCEKCGGLVKNDENHCSFYVGPGKVVYYHYICYHTRNEK